MFPIDHSSKVVLEPSWKAALADEFNQSYMRQLLQFLQQEKLARKLIYPAVPEIFAALNLTPLPAVKVVILGQDPYHGPGQAHGLCFSVRPGVPAPPSLVNIFKELSQDLGIARPEHGCLEAWAQRGVLLLNSVLTVEHGLAASHARRGWEQFTDRIIDVINSECDGVAFVLWGAYAQKKGEKVDQRRHLVLKAVHPSPLSAHRGFAGSRPFSQINAYLQEHGKGPIDWRLPPCAKVSSAVQ